MRLGGPARRVKHTFDQSMKFVQLEEIDNCDDDKVAASLSVRGMSS